MKQLRNGFLFGLGLLPLVVFSVWLFHNWPLWDPEIDAGEDFDKSQIQVGDVKLSRSDAGVRGLGDLTNRSDRVCDFLHLECDLRLDGKVIAHEIAIISNLAGRSSRGFTVFFTDIPDTIDLSKLRAQTSVALALNYDENSKGGASD